MKHAVRILALLVPVLGLVVAPTASAQRRDRTQPTERRDRGVERDRVARDKVEMDRRRERWNRMSEAERQLLTRRFRELQELSPEERRLLQERAQRLEGIQKSLRETAPDELKKEIDALDPERRERRWREHTFQRSREMGRHLRENMPSEFRRRLEAASPEERQQMLEQFMRNNEDLSRRAIHQMGRQLDVSREEIERMEKLPIEERQRAMMGLRRKMLEQRIETHGLPPGLDEATWKRMKALPDEAFLRQLRAVIPFGSDRRSRDRRERATDRAPDRPTDRPTDRPRRQSRDRREDFSRNRGGNDRF